MSLVVSIDDTAEQLNVKMNEGSSISIHVTCRDSSGVVLPLVTGNYTAKYTVKREVEDTTALITLTTSPSIVMHDTGDLDVVFTPATTLNLAITEDTTFVHDCKIYAPASGPEQFAFTGQLTVLKAVTTP